jgi:hypothetical protein
MGDESGTVLIIYGAVSECENIRTSEHPNMKSAVLQPVVLHLSLQKRNEILKLAEERVLIDIRMKST